MPVVPTEKTTKEVADSSDQRAHAIHSTGNVFTNIPALGDWKEIDGPERATFE
jgi:hypothetical protein